MGLGLLTETAEIADVYKAPDPSQVNKLHFRHLLHRFACHALEGIKLTKEEEENLKKLGSESASFLRIEAYNRVSYIQILSLLTDILKKVGIQQVGIIRLIFCFLLYFKSIQLKNKISLGISKYWKKIYTWSKILGITFLCIFSSKSCCFSPLLWM